MQMDTEKNMVCRDHSCGWITAVVVSLDGSTEPNCLQLLMRDANLEMQCSARCHGLSGFARFAPLPISCLLKGIPLLRPHGVPMS